jgi:hypothetical protein
VQQLVRSLEFSGMLCITSNKERFGPRHSRLMRLLLSVLSKENDLPLLPIPESRSIPSWREAAFRDHPCSSRLARSRSEMVRGSDRGLSPRKRMMAGRRYTRGTRATFFPLDDGRLIRSQKLPCFLYREFQIQPPLLDVLARSGRRRKRFL